MSADAADQKALDNVLGDNATTTDAPKADETPKADTPAVNGDAPAAAASSVPAAPAVVKEEEEAAPDVAPVEPKHSNLTNEATAQVTVQRQQDAQHLVAVKTWDELNLPADLLRGIVAKGFLKPSKIQEAALPLIIKHHGNIIAQAQNGSGKTATFALGMLAKIDHAHKHPQAICISPTRELATQNLEVIKTLGKYTQTTYGLIVPQMELAKDVLSAQILCGTPGKMADLVKRGTIKTANVKLFVLDEADVMINPEQNMGPQVADVRKACGKSGLQILLFSATFPDDVRKFAMNMAPLANKIIVKKEELTLSSIQQLCIQAPTKEAKFGIVCGLYGSMVVGQSVIFVNSRHDAFTLATQLKNEGNEVSLICGTSQTAGEVMDPKERDRVLDEFRKGLTKVLVATDVLARGIDVPAVTLVVNYDLPRMRGVHGEVEMETYIHRIGRTGRFGAKGISINLVSPEEQHLINDIKTYYKCDIERIEPDGEKIEEMVKKLRV
eukprot:GDKI01014102.1.p1 GENE.GDKI01014102.1~~GDKI01014102.1.p1  ORF type:complete len:497 (-),score=156.46 GDKI01014102.1:29-1519(-)